MNRAQAVTPRKTFFHTKDGSFELSTPELLEFICQNHLAGLQYLKGQIIRLEQQQKEEAEC